MTQCQPDGNTPQWALTWTRAMQVNSSRAGQGRTAGQHAASDAGHDGGDRIDGHLVVRLRRLVHLEHVRAHWPLCRQLQHTTQVSACQATGREEDNLLRGRREVQHSRQQC